jgi:hypothetical protein
VDFQIQNLSCQKSYDFLVDLKILQENLKLAGALVQTVGERHTLRTAMFESQQGCACVESQEYMDFLS